MHQFGWQYSYFQIDRPNSILQTHHWTRLYLVLRRGRETREAAATATAAMDEMDDVRMTWYPILRLLGGLCFDEQFFPCHSRGKVYTP
jgi:hypothetical protein